jgi:hypothetical protein
MGNIDSLDIQVLEKEPMETMTDQEKEIIDLFQKFLDLQHLPSVDENSGSTRVSSGKGKENDPINHAMGEEKNGA